MTPATPAFPDDVDVAIVAHNSWTTLPDTVSALIEAGCPIDHLIVVDIASGDGTPEQARRRWPAAQVYALEQNAGPNPGRNLGLARSARRFVLVMDADVLVAPDTVSLLRAAADGDPSAAVVAPVVVYADRTDVIQYAGGAIHCVCEAVNPWQDRPLAARGTTQAHIGAAPGCALLIERDAARAVGGFDERFFFGKDDGDFLHRLRIAGRTILEVPAAIAFHRSRPRSTRFFSSQLRNRWHFILKNYEWRTILGLLPVWLVHEPLQFAVLCMKGHGGAYVRAVRELLGLLPTLAADRALVRRTRQRHDRDLLVTGTLLVRDDLAGGTLGRLGKAAYERALRTYWTLLTRTVLAK